MYKTPSLILMFSGFSLACKILSTFSIKAIFTKAGSSPSVLNFSKKNEIFSIIDFVSDDFELYKIITGSSASPNK